MNTNSDTSTVREGPRHILSRRDWVYVLGLLVPFVLYNLALKATRVAALPNDHGILDGLTLMRSDLLFALGYALFWVGMFAVARRGPVRWIVVFLFHLLTILVALITSSASQYFEVTGTSLGMDPIVAFISSPGEFGGVVASEVTPTVVALLVAVTAYAVFGPWLLARLILRWRPTPGTGTPRISLLGFGGLCLAVYGLFFFSVIPAGGPAGASNSFAREPFVNLVVGEFESVRLESELNVDTAAAIENAPVETSLSRTPQTKERNVVMIHLESTRAKSVDPYNEDVEITPYIRGALRAKPLRRAGVRRRAAHDQRPHREHLRRGPAHRAAGDRRRRRRYPGQLPTRTPRRKGLQLRLLHLFGRDLRATP